MSPIVFSFFKERFIVLKLHQGNCFCQPLYVLYTQRFPS